MGKKSKSKSESKPSEVEGAKGNDSSDIFKLLFGREAPEEQGLGLGIDSNPRSGEINLQGEFDTKEASIDSGELKKKKKKGEKTNLDANVPEAIDEESEIVKKSKKKKEINAESIDEVYKKEKKGKRKKELKQDSDVDSVVTTDEVKKSKKENDGEVLLQVIPNVDKSLEQKGEEVGDLKDKRKKKKRKRDEIEEAYEAKAYGVVANVVEGDKKGTRKVGEKRKSMDDPAEMMVSKEGFDDETKLLRTVFVGNLPLKLKKKALLKEFTKFGEVESVRIRSIPIVDSKTPRKGAIMKGKINESVDSVNAYIVFKDEKSAQASLSHNMAVVEGNHIRVDKACPPRKKLKGDNTPVYDNQRTVFVGNLPFDVKDEEIYQLFCGDQSESNIEAVRVIRDPNSSVGKGIAYVLFKTKEAANLVIKKRHLKIRDRILRFYHARSDATPSKKRNLPNTSAENSRGKRLAVTSPFSHEDKNRSKTKTALSYQGLKASKTIQKKEAPKKDGFRPRSGEHGKQKSSSASGGEVKDRKNKRPAVAARKAKALKSVGASKQAGLKRKPESRTPDSLHRNKKTRKLK